MTLAVMSLPLVHPRSAVGMVKGGSNQMLAILVTLLLSMESLAEINMAQRMESSLVVFS